MIGRKVLIIGIDGASLELIKPWVEEGKLPNFSRFFSSGCVGELKSTIPVLSPTAWTSFSTGVTPGKHGIFDFFMKKSVDDFTINIGNSSLRLAKPFWTLASEVGKSVCILDVPASHPPDAVNGVMISGEPSPPTKNKFFPPDLYNELTDRFGVDFLRILSPKNTKIDLQECLLLFDKKKEVIQYLLEKRKYDLIVAVFTITDHVQHFLWHTIDKKHPKYNETEASKFGDVIFQVYRKLDEIIGELLDRTGEEYNTIILSDHGFGPLYDTLCLSKWLENNGYLVFKNNRPGKSLNIISDRIINGAFGLIKKLLLKRPARQTTEFSRAFEEIDWERSKAYFIGAAGGIYINLKGREPHGIVEPGEEFESLKEQIIKQLNALKSNVTGEEMIEKIYLSSELYSESNIESLPDILILCNNGYDILNEVVPNNHRGRPVKVPSWMGTHVLNGTLLMKGPHIKRGCTLGGAKIIDIAPTIYFLLDMEIPADLDGQILYSAIDETLKAHTSKSGNQGIRESKSQGGELGQEDMDAIKDKLKGLGYIE